MYWIEFCSVYCNMIVVQVVYLKTIEQIRNHLWVSVFPEQCSLVS